MHLQPPTTLEELAPYLSKFFSLVGRDRWFKRADQLDAEQRRSPFRGKIVADYHWLELAISFQSDVLEKQGRLPPELATMQVRAGLHFAATVVNVHDQLSPKGKKELTGRLRDALKAETGLAALYLEMDIAQRLAIGGFEVAFPDLESTAQYDIAFDDGAVSGEVECKSLSVDAGRKIHRKDFYRFIEAMTPAFFSQIERGKREILLVEFNDRLPANLDEQKELRRAVTEMLLGGEVDRICQGPFEISRLHFDDELPGVPVHDQTTLNVACQKRFGANCRAAGAMTEDTGCLIVMRSRKEDDPSKPLLDAMRKAASQFSRTRPAFIAVQFNDISPADLMMPHVRRRAGILSYALFHHYGAKHVNAACFSGFDGMVEHQGNVSTPSFSVPNREPKYPLVSSDLCTFLSHISDHEFAEILGAPLPAENISHIPFATD